MCQLCKSWGIDLHAEQFGTVSDDLTITLMPGGPGNFVTAGTRWTDNGNASGSYTTTLGGSGGVVAWSVTAAGLLDTSNGGFFNGPTVTLGSFLPFDYQAVLRSAFDAWSAVANIEFIQVEDNGGNIGSGAYPTIRISGAYIDGEDYSGVLARAYYPSSTPYGGDIVFDTGDAAFFSNQHDFFLTALHEIGHAIGLSHEEVEVAIMNPTINPALSGLMPDDVNGIRAVYGNQDFDPNTYYMPSSLANLTILDGSPSLTVMGNAANNSIVGTREAETINGGGGNDTLASGGGDGADTLSGGLGDDTYIVDGTPVTMVESAGQGTDTVTTWSSFSLGDNFENLTLTGGYDVNGTGNAGNNTIVGNARDNVLDGGAGNDRLDGGSDGLDTLIGGLGDDTYVVDRLTVTVTESAGEGTDTVMASFSYALDDDFENLTLTGANNVIGTGNSGNNRLTGNAGDNTLIGGLGDDTYIVDQQLDKVIEIAGEGTDTVLASLSYTLGDNVENLTLTGGINGTGNSGNNWIIGNSGNNVLDGGAGDDRLDGGGLSSDKFIGGLGDDTYIVDGWFSEVIENGNEGADTVMASMSFTLGANIENLTLTGTDGIYGTGNSADNIIVGNSGSNRLHGGSAGMDILMGGQGNDLYTVDHRSVLVIENADEGTDTVYASVDFALGANVESLTLYSDFQPLSGFGNDLANRLAGNFGNNVLDGGAGDDQLLGGWGSDVLVGGDGADALSGDLDADYLLIDAADTSIDGGTGFDSVFVQTAAAVTLNMGTASIEWAQGNAGADTFNAASQTSAVYIYGMGGNDTLTGSAFGDYLDGGDGTDTLAGGDGADLLLGNGGSDILRGQGGNDSLIELGGDNVIDGGAGFDSLFVWSDTGATLNLTTASIEWVQGSVLGDDNLDAASNTVNTFLYGWGGNDVLTAGLGDDYVAGGTGDDILTGGAGSDTLIGESGFDRYVYTAATWGSDTIHSFDFNGEKLDFTAVAAIDSFSDFTAFEWDPGNLGYNSTTLFYTNGGTTSAITLIGVQTASLSDADFLFA